MNLGPFGYFNAITGFPWTAPFGCNGPHSEGDSKDTTTTLRDTGALVVDMVPAERKVQMSASSAQVGRTVSALEQAGLTLLPSERGAAPPGPGGLPGRRRDLLHGSS
jgi:flavin reductase (DIM6/NTAB) family NADH-FMN oxidoreductase RutF